MASKAARYARYLPQEKLEISLFPFLSIFLCVMGVLSFINILSSVSTPQKIELTMELEQGYKVAFQVFTMPDGVISVPPINRLLELQQWSMMISCLIGNDYSASAGCDRRS